MGTPNFPKAVLAKLPILSADEAGKAKQSEREVEGLVPELFLGFNALKTSEPAGQWAEVRAT